MTVFAIVLLFTVMLVVAVLLAAVYTSACGLEGNQVQVKRSLRFIGIVLLGETVAFRSWVLLPFAFFCFVLSHPKVNLPKFARRVDKSLADGR